MAVNGIFRVAGNEYIKWIRNPRMIIVPVMMIFAYDYVIKELTDTADKMGEKLQLFEGFIGISNSQLLLMIIPIVFVGLMGDSPRVDGNAMFYIHRVGRNNWLIGQIVFAVMAAGTYLMALTAFSVVMLAERCFTANIWSEVTTKYYIFAPNDYMSKMANLTTGRLYNNLLPVDAALNIIGLMFLMLIVISMLILVFFVCRARIAGIVAATGILCVGNVLAYTKNSIRWLFPTAHAVLEIHFDEIYRKPVMDIRMSYLYYIVLLIILSVIAFVCIDGYDFSKIRELEE